MGWKLIASPPAMSLAAYSSPAYTTTGTITGAPAPVVAAAPQPAYSASLPTVSAAPAPVGYSAPAVSLAPRSTPFVPVPAAGYTLPQTGYAQAAPVNTFSAATFPAASFVAPAPQVPYAQPAALPAATSMVATPAYQPAYQQTAYGAPQYEAYGTYPAYGTQTEYVVAPTTTKKKRFGCC